MWVFKVVKKVKIVLKMTHRLALIVCLMKSLGTCNSWLRFSDLIWRGSMHGRLRYVSKTTFSSLIFIRWQTWPFPKESFWVFLLFINNNPGAVWFIPSHKFPRHAQNSRVPIWCFGVKLVVKLSINPKPLEAVKTWELPDWRPTLIRVIGPSF